MAHPKRRTSPTNTKRSLEFAGRAIDLINRTFSKDTSSNQYNVQPSNNISTSYNENLIRPVNNRNKNKKKDGGSIHIAPSKRGTFTAAATKHGMGVQEFASKVLRNKEDYSPSLVKKANFARNASKWH